MGEPVRSEPVDQSKGVAEVVVEAGTDDTGRQRVANVADVLANLVPYVGNLGSCRFPLQVDENGCYPGAGVAAQVIEAFGFLQFAFEAFGHLLKGVIEGCAGPRGLDNHRPEGECGIFATT